MFIHLEDIGTLGFHIATENYEELFIVQQKYLTAAFIINMN